MVYSVGYVNAYIESGEDKNGISQTSSTTSASNTTSATSSTTSASNTTSATSSTSEDSYVDVSLSDSTGDETTASQITLYYVQFEQQKLNKENEIRKKEAEIQKLESKLNSTTDKDEQATIRSKINTLNNQIDSLREEILDFSQTYLNNVTMLISQQTYSSSLAAAGYTDAEINNNINIISTTSSKAANYALAFAGKSASQMASIMQGAGYAYHDRAWCGDFVNFAVSQAGGHIPSWYANCSNKAYCPTIQDAGRAAGAKIDISQVKPGDIVLFQYHGSGGADHVGIVVSINSDGTFTTIEGNTGGQVSTHTYSQNDSSVCDFLSMGVA